MSEYTKGPWKVDRTGDYYKPCVRTNDVIVALLPESKVNDCLVAAAPELLEAVKGAVAWLDNIETRLGLEMVNLMPNNILGRPAMLRLIAKAEGR